MEDKVQELYRLEGAIAYHDYLYFAADNPVISDSAYDQLVARYLELKDEVPDFVQTVIPGFINHDNLLAVEALTEPMLSVDKFKNKEAIEKWQLRQLAKFFWIAEKKIDGVALRVTYEYGKLVKLNLRGDGFGTIVTHRVGIMPTLKRFVKAFELLAHVEVTGEAYVLLAELEEYAAQWKVDSPESRSTINGMLKRKQPEESDTLNIRFKAFMLDKETRKDMKTYEEMSESLQAAGFEIPERLNDEELEEAYNATERPIGAFAIDGVVIKNNDLSKWADTHMKGYWSFMVCYKYPTCSFTTILRNVDWKLNTKGYLEGTLEFDPVDYDGSTIRRAKFDYVNNYIKAGLRIGSRIEITKANEIIPNLVGLVEIGDGELVKFPELCPSCESVLIVDGDSSAHCDNDECPGTLLSRLERAVSPKGLNIQNLGEKRLTLLINSGYLFSIARLFDLSLTDYDNVGISAAIAEKVVKQIEKAKTLGLNHWLYALCIPHIGYTRATELAAEYGIAFNDLNSLILLMSDSDEMSGRFGVNGLEIAVWVKQNEVSFHQYLVNFDWSHYTVEVPKLIPVACTGAWVYTRREIKDQLEHYGFNVEENLNKSTSVLLIGDKPSPGTVAKAERWGIPTIELKPTMSFKELVAILRG